jgi:uncharacterized membrane protein YphA (DoxX/SURF4 family)
MWISKSINLWASLFVGITFLCSGTIKLNDPRGFADKIEEYLHLLASQLTAHIRLLLPYTLVLAVCMATLETVLGVALLVHWQRFWVLQALLLLTLFFTCLTLYTATSKRIASCGCFGDALALTPWQSFTKSVVLLLLIGGLCWQEKDPPNSLNSYYWVAAALIGSVGLSRHILRHLPLWDFLPYKVGSDLTKQHPDEIALSANLCVWKGDQEVTQALLSGNKLVLIIQHPASITASTLQKLYVLIRRLQEDVKPILITPMGQCQEAALILALPRYTAHPRLLRDMLRAPWGLLLLQGGVVRYKYSMNDLSQAQKSLRQHGWLKK